MIYRNISAIITKQSKKMPVIGITGPRQSGKTTLAKKLFSKYTYTTLENPETRAFAEKDPKKFLTTFKNGLIIDEIQYIPKLFSYIQVFVDESEKNGQYIITGSQNFLLLEKITQSLAGRISIFNLLPLSLDELTKAKYKFADVNDYIFRGFYPRLFDQKIAPDSFYLDYINTYVERDVRQIINVKDLQQFQLFIRLCAGRVGQLINYSNLGNDVGVTDKTIKHWLNILEASFIIFKLQPYHKNYNKRLVKSGKLFFYDTGLLCSLLGLKSAKELSVHFAKGGIFENFIICEIVKHNLNHSLHRKLYFWRDKAGHEIDLIIEKANNIIPIEIKSSNTINENFFNGLRYFNKLANRDTNKLNSYIIYGGKEKQDRTEAKVINWEMLNQLPLD